MPLGLIMMGGMVLSGFTSSVISSTKGIDDACNTLSTVTNNYQQTKKAWNTALTAAGGLKEEAKQQAQELVNAYSGYKDALKKQKELFQAKQTMTDIWIGVFVLVLLLNLLFKYFNIYGLIYDIIMNKK